jgi:lactoylglutathione lyase
VSAVAIVALGALAAAPAIERPPILGLSHVAFQVSDLGRARAFYGGLLGYDECFRPARPRYSEPVCFQINDHQYVEIAPGPTAAQDDRLSHVAFETTDVEALRAYLEARGIAAGAPLVEPAGNRIVRLKDPDGHAVDFVQYLPASRLRSARPSARRISARLLHVGLTVGDVSAADRFYKDVLGFSEIWRGGTSEGVTSWINMKVPDGTDYLEYMLVSGPVDRERLGVLHHMALMVPDIQAALETVRTRPGGTDRRTVRAPQVGRNGRWQLNLFDPDGSRCELMEPFTMR